MADGDSEQPVFQPEGPFDDRVVPEDVGLDLLVEGIAAAGGLAVFPRGSADRAEAEADWAAFAARLRAAPPVPLAIMARALALDPFALRCVLLAAAAHVEPRLVSLRALRPSAGAFGGAPTVGLALDRFCETAAERVAARQTFLPGAPLVRHGVVVLQAPEDAPGGLLESTIALSSVAVELLLSEEALVEAVTSHTHLSRPAVSLLSVILDEDAQRLARELVENHRGYRDVLVRWGLTTVLPQGRGLVLLFSGASGTGKTLLAQALAAHTGRLLLTVAAAELPEGPAVAGALRDVLNEAALRDALVLVEDCEALLGAGDPRRATASRAFEAFTGILVLTTSRPDRLDPSVERRVAWHLPLERPDQSQRRQIWEVHLPPDVPLAADVDLDRLAATYDFTGAEIRNAALMAVNRAVAGAPAAPRLTDALLEEGCRTQLAYALHELTIRTSTDLRLKDLVLPPDAERDVRTILAACRNQAHVLNRWGFGRRLATGKGITVLFDGPPGTGKTYCAEILAGELERPLYRVNLPEVVSKWIGETEKHIRAIFQHARTSHALLLFDEADSLFARRSRETRSATDRYANLQVNLLLQEIERFPGVCILTTNFFGSLDDALIRRIQFRVTFQEPDEGQRRRLWEVLCPAAAPLANDVDFAALARDFDLTGALVKNALLRAAYRACAERTPLTQAVLLAACRDEYQAAGRVVRPPRAPAAR